MDIKTLKTFCTVADRRGFSQAAEVLGLTQPTVSFHISALERELGTKLLDRGGRTTFLTKSGEVYYSFAMRILEIESEAQQAISKLEGLIQGDVNVGASNIPGTYILPSVLQKFKARYPDLEVTLTIDDTGGIIRRIHNNQIELGVVGANDGSTKLTYSRFVTDRLVLIASSRSDWIAGEKVTLEDICHIPFIMREDGSGTRTILQRRLQEANLPLKALDISMTLGSTEAVKMAVESGAGISIVSERAVKREVELGLIKTIEIANLSLERDFYIVHRNQRDLSAAAAAMKQFLSEGWKK